MEICSLSNDAVPRISTEIKRILHLSEQSKAREWYIYHNFSEIRIYGCELRAYKLPIFLPMMIFALEYIKQMMNMNDTHFVSRKHKAHFKLKARVGPFIVNTRDAEKEVMICKSG